MAVRRTAQGHGVLTALLAVISEQLQGRITLIES
jgi:hypothetical protein